jgi:hypothetical protein
MDASDAVQEVISAIIIVEASGEIRFPES